LKHRGRKRGGDVKGKRRIITTWREGPMGEAIVLYIEINERRKFPGGENLE